MALKDRIKWLKDEMAREKTRKYKLSIKNSKHMNQTELSNRKIQVLEEQSYRNNILINEVTDDVTELNRELNRLEM